MTNELFDCDLIDRVVALDAAFTRYNSVRALQARDGQLEERRFGRAVAFRDGARPEPYYNRVLGFGEPELAALDDVIAFHHEKRIPCTVALTPDRGTAEVLAALAERGFRLLDTDWVSAVACAGDLGSPAQVEIRRADPEDLDLVVDLWGVDSDERAPPDVVERRGAAQWVPEFPIYLASLDGRVVAMASMFVANDVAWLGNAATSPDARRRGCQLALLHHRIREAARAGCDWAVADAKYGTTSHRNFQRAGMQTCFAQLSLALPPS